MMAIEAISRITVENEVEIVAKAICTFPRGETREFYVTRFSPFDLFVMALRPPPIQAEEKRPVGERRADLRIRTDFAATVVIPGRRLNARVVDLSMSGARLEFGKDALTAEIVAGTLFSIGINAGNHPEGFSLKAEAIHRISGGSTISVGVRFLDVNSETSSKIEQIMLAIIGRIDADGTKLYS